MIYTSLIFPLTSRFYAEDHPACRNPFTAEPQHTWRLNSPIWNGKKRNAMWPAKTSVGMSCVNRRAQCVLLQITSIMTLGSLPRLQVSLARRALLQRTELVPDRRLPVFCSFDQRQRFLSSAAKATRQRPSPVNPKVGIYVAQEPWTYLDIRSLQESNMETKTAQTGMKIEMEGRMEILQCPDLQIDRSQPSPQRI